MINFKKFKTILWILGILIIIFLVFFLYQMSTTEGFGTMMLPIMLILGLILGGVIAFLASNKLKTEPPIIQESSHTIAESMRKVFKIVSAEGHFNEIYNYEESSKIFGFLPSKKKALVIVTAKVLVGYDFEKLKWEVDEINRSVKLVDFPAPEILSTETDYKYYNIEEQFFNLFSKDDLGKIQQNSKQLIVEAAKKSHLPEVAAEQMKMLLTELLSSKNYQLENVGTISSNPKQLDFNPIRYTQNL